jgi:(heptosyl)LPS beta-1,4-glucosyltransferase
MKAGISVVIIAYNQASLLKNCLHSVVDWADEVLVIDLESTEDIIGVAQSFPHVRYHRLPHVDIVEKVRQKVLGFVATSYVLFLDTDETVPRDLAIKLQQYAKSDAYDYVRIPRQNTVFGHWMKYSRWWPDYQVRFFKVGKVTWPQVLHAPPETAGVGYDLPAEARHAIAHFNYQSIDEWFEKNRRYAKQDAAGRQSRGERYTLTDSLRLSISELMSRYYQGKGYRDGVHGLLLAILQSFYYFWVYAYYWEMAGYKAPESKEELYHFPTTWFRHGLVESLFWDADSTSPLKKIKQKFVRKLIG